jgi:hypothetical protein
MIAKAMKQAAAIKCYSHECVGALLAWKQTEHYF